MLMEQGEQHSLLQGLQTSQAVRLATMHDHQERCKLLNLTVPQFIVIKVETW